MIPKLPLLALAMLFAWSPTATAIPVQWSSASGGNDHFYEAILAPEGIDWAAANSAAQSRPGGWHLVTITSAAENAFVYSLFSGNPGFFNSAYFDTGPWLGATHVGPGAGDYAWVTGEVFSYANWAPVEPYNNGDRISFFGFQPQGGPPDSWDDIPSSKLLTGYIVESPIPEPSTALLLGVGLAALAARRRVR